MELCSAISAVNTEILKVLLMGWEELWLMLWYLSYLFSVPSVKYKFWMGPHQTIPLCNLTSYPSCHSIGTMGPLLSLVYHVSLHDPRNFVHAGQERLSFNVIKPSPPTNAISSRLAYLINIPMEDARFTA